MAFVKKFLIIFVFLLAFSAQAMNCAIADKLMDPKLANNTKFWEQFSRLEDQSEEAVAKLIKQHDPDFEIPNSIVSQNVVQNAVQSVASNVSLNLSKKSVKAIKFLTKTQKKNLDTFLDIVSKEGGYKELYRNPGKWHAEKLPEYGGDHSIRLDEGMRVLFRIEKGAVNVLEISKDIGH